MAKFALKGGLYFMKKKPVFIVSGLPRSGTSLMMQMLAAGGIPILTDNQRAADAHNPKGYFELEAVKKMETERIFLLKAQGKVVKIISHLLPFLPKGPDYKILFMNRNLNAVIQSQNKMLLKTNKNKGTISDAQLEEMYRKHLAEIDFWLKHQNNLSYITIQYEQLIKQPYETALKIQTFLELDSVAEEMARRVDSSLNHFRPL